MSTTISILGVLVALVVLTVFIMRGVHILVTALICSGIVAITGGLDLYDAFKESYMSGFVGFFKSYFLMFLTGTLIGKFMEVSNGAKAISKLLVNLLGKERALIAIPLACGVLAYGGVSVFVVGFAVFPIALEVFREADIPRRFIPAAITFGSITFVMVMPGAPQIQNIVPTQYCGTDLMAGATVGFIVSIVMLIVGTIILTRFVSNAKAKGERFVAKDVDVFHEDKNLPNGVLALIPLIITIVLINIKVNGANLVNLETGLFAGVLLTIVFLNRNLVIKEIPNHFGEGCKTSIFAIANTCAVVGFGSVVKAVPAFQAVVNAMINVPGPALLGAAIGICVIAGITGSASGGLGIGVPLIAPVYLAMGVNPEELHRVMTMASAGLDSLPHNGYIVTVTNGLCNETHKDAYMPQFWLTVVLPICGTLLGLLLFSIL